MTNAELKEQLEKSVATLKEDLKQIRTGRASTSLLDSIKVEAYNSKMSIQELGNITMPDPRTLVISPWDKSLIDNIAKAIRTSELQVNPVVEGDRVRISFPGLTEERRKEYAKVVSDRMEESRQRIRRIRQDAMKDVDRKFSEKEISEDQKFSRREEIEEIVKEYNKKVEEVGEKKTQEIMTV